MTVPAWRLTLQSRVLSVTIVLALWVAAIVTRLVFLQVVAHADLVARAERQQKRTQEAVAKRGDILDRRGHLLATSVDADTIYAVPSEIADAGDAVAKLCRAFTDCTRKERAALIEKLAQQRAFVYVRRQVSPELAARVAALKLEGIGFLKESRRFYPNRELAAHLLGWVNIDNKGMAGIESTYDSKIGGKNGTILIQTDAKRRVFSRVERPPVAGPSIELTIDEYLQHIAERELLASVAAHRAEGGSAIIMNPRTGEILAMVGSRDYFREDIDGTVNNAVALNSPGSTLKPFTVALALDTNRITPASTFQTSPGRMTIGTATISDSHEHGLLTVSQIIQKSSNIGTAKIALQMPPHEMWELFTAAGFGQQPRFGFPGAVAGRVRPYKSWRPIEQATMSYGHGISVSLIQLARAYTIFARDGDLIPLSFLKLDQAPVGQRIISQKTARDLRAMLETVVSPEGTAPKAQVPGYRVGGKTGTAYKIVGGKYVRNYVASFVGFAPASDPRIIVAVMVDEPTGGHYGGEVAAPVFAAVTASALRAMNVAPDSSVTDIIIPADAVQESM